MEGYRAYILGADGRVQNRVDLVCDDEAEAIRLAKQLVDGHDVELWQLGRLVETFTVLPSANLDSARSQNSKSRSEGRPFCSHSSRARTVISCLVRLALRRSRSFCLNSSMNALSRS